MTRAVFIPGADRNRSSTSCNNPAPGTPAADAKEERDRAKAARKGLKTPAQLEEER